MCNRSRMIDRRCPACNRPVLGTREVVHVLLTVNDENVKTCPHCDIAVSLVRNDDPILPDGEEYYFVTSN